MVEREIAPGRCGLLIIEHLPLSIENLAGISMNITEAHALIKRQARAWEQAEMFISGFTIPGAE